ncbi:hypothetical protein BS78_08G071500 [Paspalum vaginatum]|nr:hypothetical protein BS78_08G071500 [Paspalum vaginatum]
MAHPSPSPSGSSSRSRRRLSEVLREQQEPFSLDLYLLEKGCSPAFLDACGGGACSTCWPRTRSAGMLRWPARSKKSSRGSRGVLRLLLSKILSGKTTTAAPAPTRKRRQPAAIDWHHVVEEERTPDRSEHGFASPSPRMEEEDEEDEAPKRQLSPVSVLEQRLFEHSAPPPPPPHAQKALAIFSELLEAAYTPASLLEDLLAHAKADRSKDGPTPPRARKEKGHGHRHHAHREEKDLGRVSAALVASEMGGAEELWAWAQDVAAAVLDALTEETASELMLRDDDDDGDGPRLCG